MVARPMERTMAEKEPTQRWVDSQVRSATVLATEAGAGILADNEETRAEALDSLHDAIDDLTRLRDRIESAGT